MATGIEMTGSPFWDIFIFCITHLVALIMPFLGGAGKFLEKMQVKLQESKKKEARFLAAIVKEAIKELQEPKEPKDTVIPAP